MKLVEANFEAVDIQQDTSLFRPISGRRILSIRRLSIERKDIFRWRRRLSGLGRVLVSLAMIFHFGALALASLPWSPFVQSLFPYYRWYIDGTSQQQGWGMYQFPQHISPGYRVVATMPDGSTNEPLGIPSKIDSRMLYFIESTFFGNEKLAMPFMEYLYREFPEYQRPEKIEMFYAVSKIAPLAVKAPEAGYLGEAKDEGKFIRSW